MVDFSLDMDMGSIIWLALHSAGVLTTKRLRVSRIRRSDDCIRLHQLSHRLVRVHLT